MGSGSVESSSLRGPGLRFVVDSVIGIREESQALSSAIAVVAIVGSGC